MIGIDPGIAITGTAVIERTGGRPRALEVGVVRTAPGAPHAHRLAELRVALVRLMDASEPDAVAVERLFFNANAKTAMAVGQASGVVLATAAEHGVDVATYTPLEVKQSVVGFGGASKHQVQVMVARMLDLGAPPTPPDAADACALAICHLSRSGLARAVTKAIG